MSGEDSTLRRKSKYACAPAMYLYTNRNLAYGIEKLCNIRLHHIEVVCSIRAHETVSFWSKERENWAVVYVLME